MELNDVGSKVKKSVRGSVWISVWDSMGDSVSFSVYVPVSRSVTGFVLDSTQFKNQLSQRVQNEIG
jgi:uncharacterized protein YfaA (DUF2138 family)